MIVHEAAIVDLKTSMEQPGLVNDVNVDRTVNLLDLETGRAQAPVFRHGVSEPSVVLGEYIQRQSKR